MQFLVHPRGSGDRVRGVESATSAGVWPYSPSPSLVGCFATARVGQDIIRPLGTDLLVVMVRTSTAGFCDAASKSVVSTPIEVEGLPTSNTSACYMHL
jgi:hypothetical protein